jgi:membrane protease subunit (stomatin/prohibitin family)
VKWNGDPSIFAWKYPSQELSTATQLIVNESQEAFVVKAGTYQGPFGSGRHTLSTENIPLLRSLIGVPFGGRSPFTAEVWFVNRVTNLNVRWGTQDAIQLQDPKYQIMVPVRAFGQYGICIIDSKKFLLKLVGTLPAFDADTLSAYFKGVFVTKIKTGIATAIIRNGRSVLDISTELEKLSGMLGEMLAPELASYGVGLEQFNIHSINVPEDDPAVVTLKAALAKRTEMGLLGFTYQQERSFDVLQTAAGNEGTAGGVMGAGIGMAMGVGIGAPIGAAAAQVAPQVQPGVKPGAPRPDEGTAPATCQKCRAVNPAGMRFCGVCGSTLSQAVPASMTCDRCGTAVPRGAKFCPNCADPVNACPNCGEDNPATSIKCRSCGHAMPQSCRACSASVPDGAKFCPECGVKVLLACSKCGVDLLPSVKFCPNCGEPQQAS